MANRLGNSSIEVVYYHNSYWGFDMSSIGEVLRFVRKDGGGKKIKLGKTAVNALIKLDSIRI